MNKKIQTFAIVIACIALSFASIADAVTVVIECSNGYTITKDCGDKCLEVNCVDRTWSCACCPE